MNLQRTGITRFLLRPDIIPALRQLANRAPDSKRSAVLLDSVPAESGRSRLTGQLMVWQGIVELLSGESCLVQYFFQFFTVE